MDELYFGRPDEDLYLMHVGRSKEDGAPGPGSGRYPKGSGENPNQREPHKAWSYEETQIFWLEADRLQKKTVCCQKCKDR